MNHSTDIPIDNSISCQALKHLDIPSNRRSISKGVHFVKSRSKRSVPLSIRFDKYFMQEQSQLAKLTKDEFEFICKEFLKVRELFVTKLELHPEKLNISVTSDPSLHFTMVYNSTVMLFVEIFVNEDETMDCFTMISKNKEVVFESEVHVSKQVNQIVDVIQS